NAPSTSAPQDRTGEVARVGSRETDALFGREREQVEDRGSIDPGDLVLDLLPRGHDGIVVTYREHVPSPIIRSVEGADSVRPPACHAGGLTTDRSPWLDIRNSFTGSLLLPDEEQSMFAGRPPRRGAPPPVESAAG